MTRVAALVNVPSPGVSCSPRSTRSRCWYRHWSRCSRGLGRRREIGCGDVGAAGGEVVGEAVAGDRDTDAGGRHRGLSAKLHWRCCRCSGPKSGPQGCRRIGARGIRSALCRGNGGAAAELENQLSPMSGRRRRSHDVGVECVEAGRRRRNRVADGRGAGHLGRVGGNSRRAGDRGVVQGTGGGLLCLLRSRQRLFEQARQAGEAVVGSVEGLLALTDLVQQRAQVVGGLGEGLRGEKGLGFSEAELTFLPVENGS